MNRTIYPSTSLLAYKWISLILWVIMTPISSIAQLSPIHTFNTAQYGGSKQNWDIVSQGDFIYVANNEGLLEYDGSHWRLYRLPNRTIIRSLAIIGDRIYSGSYEDFGFWTRDAAGDLGYHSLCDTITQKHIESHAVWSIQGIGDRVIFRTFASIVIYDGKGNTVISPNTPLLCDAILGNRYVVFQKEKGIQVLFGDSLQAYHSPSPRSTPVIETMASIGGTDSILLGSGLEGAFLLQPSGVSRYDEALNKKLQMDQLNDILVTTHNIYFGTIKNGLYVLDRKTGEIENINTTKGLQNNTILASCVDKNGNIWLAHDNGISAIQQKYFAHYLCHTDNDIGVVHDILVLEDVVYAATNTGIYSLQDGTATFIEGSQGHTWKLSQLEDGSIMCGHNSGTYLLDDNRLLPISNFSGGYYFQPIPYQPSYYIQGHYSGLSIYHKDQNKWKSKRIKGIDFPIHKIIFTDPTTAWVQHAYKGIFRISLNKDLTEVLQIRTQYNDQIPNIYDVRLYRAYGKIAFYSDKNWFYYDRLKDSIKPYDDLSKILLPHAKSCPISSFESDPVVLLTPDEKLLFMPQNKHGAKTLIPQNLYKNKLLRGEGTQRAYVQHKGQIFLALDNNILVISHDDMQDFPSSRQLTNLRLRINSQYRSMKEKIIVNSKDQIEIFVGQPLLQDRQTEYRIIPSQTNWLEIPSQFTIPSLPHGRLEIQVRQKNITGEYTEPTTFLLYNTPPWHMGWKGALMVLTSALLLVLGITKLNKYTLVKHKKYLNEQYVHQQALKEKEIVIQHEKKINELLKKQHEIKINAKAKELANTALSLAKKNELLQKMKTEISELRENSENPNSLNKILTRIDRNLHKEKDWKVFEDNLDEIHDSFYHTLVARHDGQQLTSRDLKLAAYLRMNLSSKEIAPLMGISVRGVEIHRYRFRKKLNIDKNQNLSEYLLNL